MRLSRVLSGLPSSSWIDVSTHCLTAGVHRDWQKCKCSYSAILPFICRSSTGHPVWTLSHPHSGAGASPAFPCCLEGHSCGSRGLQCCHQQGDPQLGPSALCRAWQGERTEKEILALLPPHLKWVRGCQGLCSREKKDGVHGSCVTPSWWAGSQARQHLMGQHRRKGFLLLTPHLLQRSRFKRSQPSVVMSLQPRTGRTVGHDCCLCGELHWHSVLGRSFPRSLVCSLLPWTMLAETAAQDPSCLPVSSTRFRGPGSVLLPSLQTVKKQPPLVHWLCGGCTDHSQRGCRARAVGVTLGAGQPSPLTADPFPSPGRLEPA